jgi:uncharacterized lipoprotein YmbA
MPETRIYTLFIPSESSSDVLKSRNSLVIRVRSERYLKQPYIAHRSSPYQLKISKYSRWELPPDKLVGKELKKGFLSAGFFKEVRASNIVPSGFYVLNIYLKNFERVDTGNDSFGRLVLDAALLDPVGVELYRTTLSGEVKLGDKSFENLAEGLSAALKQGIEDMRRKIEQVLSPLSWGLQ